MSLWICHKCVKLYPGNTHVCPDCNVQLELAIIRDEILEKKNNIKDAEPVFEMTLEEVKALLKEMEYSFLSYDNPLGHSVISRLMAFRKQHGVD